MKNLAKQVYQRAGYNEADATAWANLFEVVWEVNQDLKREGKKDLLTQLREKRSKQAQASQEPTGIKAAILHASLIGLLVIICSTMAVAFPGNA